MCSPRKATTTGVRLLCKCVNNQELKKKLGRSRWATAAHMVTGVDKTRAGFRGSRDTVASTTRVNAAPKIPSTMTSTKMKSSSGSSVVVNVVHQDSSIASKRNLCTSVANNTQGRTKAASTRNWVAAIVKEPALHCGGLHPHGNTTERPVLATVGPRRVAPLKNVHAKGSWDAKGTLDCKIQPLCGKVTKLKVLLGPGVECPQAGKQVSNVSRPEEDMQPYSVADTCDQTQHQEGGQSHTQDLRAGMMQANGEVSTLQEKLRCAQAEAARLQDALSELEGKFWSYREEAQRQVALQQSELKEKEAEIVDMKETIFELVDEVEQYRAVKQHDNLAISELENFVKKLQEQKCNMDHDMKALLHRYKEEMAEWQELQADLQTAVVVADKIREQAQEELEVLKQELCKAQERNKELSRELEEARKQHVSSRPEVVWSPVNSVLKNVARLYQDVGEAHISSSSPSTIRTLIKAFNLASQGFMPCHRTIAMETLRMPRSPLSPGPLRSPPTASVAPVQTPYTAGPASHCLVMDKRLNKSDKSSQLKDKWYSEFSDLLDPCSLGGQQFPPQDLFTTDGQDMKGDVTLAENSTPFPLKTLGFTTSTIATASFLPPCCRSMSTVQSSLQDVPRDPLRELALKKGESKRCVLLRWCQEKTQGYQNINIKNFSSSWKDGLALCAILHTYLPEKIPFQELNGQDKRRNLTLAVQAAESVGIKCSLDISEMLRVERPDWQRVMDYITSVYQYFES